MAPLTYKVNLKYDFKSINSTVEFALIDFFAIPLVA